MIERPAPMLARLMRSLPRGDQWRYEPKLDGFSGLLWHRGNGVVQLFSRNVRDLAPWFPELVRAGQSLPADTLLDGEIVIANEHGHSDFGALQNRLTVARRQAETASRRMPSVLLVFDLLRLAGDELTCQPLIHRWAELERTVSGDNAFIQLVTQTSDAGLAEEWLRFIPALEGVVAKRADSRYLPGRREWIKVKRQRTADCVVIGLAGDSAAPSLVLALNHSDQQLHLLGRLCGVICHLEWTRCMPLKTRQSVFRRERAEQQGGVPRDETVPIGSACSQFVVEARSRPIRSL